MSPADALSSLHSLAAELGAIIAAFEPSHLLDWLTGSTSDYVSAVFHAFVLGTGNAERPGAAFVTAPTIRRFEPVCQGAADVGLVAAFAWGCYRAMWSSSAGSAAAARHMLPRAVLAVVLINFSQTLLQAAVEVNNALCQSVPWSGAGLDAVPRVSTGAGAAPIELLVGAALATGYAVLAFAYVVRYALLVVLAIAAPLAGLFFVLPDTHRYARQWAHLFVPALFMQPLQLLILGIGFSLNETASGLPGRLFALASLFLVFKVPAALSAAARLGTHAGAGRGWAGHLAGAAF
ncbi:MAG: hypothetical protein ACREPI_08685 [Candidatus Dormibacterales bacterium]